jgi:hypothetical protein
MALVCLINVCIATYESTLFSEEGPLNYTLWRALPDVYVIHDRPFYTSMVLSLLLV